VAVLVGLDGRRLNRTLPGRFSGGNPLRGPFPPLWSDGDTFDSMGDHGTPSGRLLSYENVYRTQSAVAACVNKLARQIAVVPIRVFKVNGPDNRTLVTDPENPLRSLISRPAPRRGELHFKQWLAVPALTHGNGLLAKFREESDAPPTALLPVKWQYASAYAEQGGPVEWWSTTQTGEERFFPVEESVHVGWESPGGEIGTSPLEQLGTTVRLEDAAQRYSTSSFQNAARPSLAVILPPGQGRDIVDQVREQVQGTHGGVDNAFLTMVLGGGADVKTLSHSAAEAELVEQRRLNFEEVCRVYDVAPQLLGDARNASYNTMSEVKKMLYQTTLMPWLDLIQATLQAQLIDGEEEFAGYEVEFELRDLLRGTPSEELAAAVQGFTNGILSRNEVRSTLGLPKLPGEENDLPMTPTNNLTPAGAGADGRADPNNPRGARGGTAEPVDSPPVSQQ
jgi:HK97 family phage portal protein